MKVQKTIPQKIELIFDGCYLITTLGLGMILVLSNQATEGRLWGVMAMILAIGDSFHLLPRMAIAYTGNTTQYAMLKGHGKMVTSITMTVFYMMLWQIGLSLFQVTLGELTFLLYGLGIIRIILCLLPQNDWQKESDDNKLGILRNIPFLIIGAQVTWLYLNYGNVMPTMQYVGLAVLISFACYLPVVLWVHKNPKLGMLMLPKTIAYLVIVLLGFGI